MYIDSRLEFSDAQALTATAASSSVVDLGADRKLASGQTLFRSQRPGVRHGDV